MGMRRLRQSNISFLLFADVYIINDNHLPLVGIKLNGKYAFSVWPPMTDRKFEFFRTNMLHPK